MRVVGDVGDLGHLAVGLRGRISSAPSASSSIYDYPGVIYEVEINADHDYWDVAEIDLRPADIKPQDDVVDHPSHYTQYKGVEVIQLTEQMNFNRGNAVKYIARAGLKDPAKEIEDLKKSRWYIDREINRLQDGDSA